MFILRKRYILLVVITAAIVCWLMSSHSESDDLIFDTAYVIDLLDAKSAQEKKLDELETDKKKLEQNLELLKQNGLLASADLLLSQDSLSTCQTDLANLQDLSAQQAIARKEKQNQQDYSQQQCSDNKVALTFVKNQIADLHQQIDKLTAENRGLIAEAASSAQAIETQHKKADTFEKQKATYTSTITTLTNDLATPIYVKKLYVTPKFCQSADPTSEICLDKILILPRFSKTPVTEVVLRIVAPNSRVIAELNYNASDNKVISFPFERGIDLPSGQYNFVFEVDKQNLVEHYPLSQAEL